MLYVSVTSFVAVTVIVPVATVHVGCNVTDATGVVGAVGAALTVTLVAVLIHPLAFFIVTLYVPGTTPVNRPFKLVYEIPSILYESV